MASPNILAALAGGLQGGIQGYETAQDLADRKLQRQAVLDQITARAQYQRALEQDRQDRLQQQAKAEADAAAAKTQAAKDRQQAAQAAFYKDNRTWLAQTPHGRQLLSNFYKASGYDLEPDDLDPTNALVPSSLQGAPPDVIAAWKANQATGGKLTVTPEMMQTPAQRAAAAALKKQADNNAAFALFQREHQFDQSLTANKPIPDDPSLPVGVKQWMATLPAQANGDYAAANDAFVAGLSDQLKAHPHLDLSKARQAFNAQFAPDAVPPKPSATSAVVSHVLDKTASQGPAAAPAPAPTSTPTPPPIDPTDPHAALRQQIRSTADPTQRVVLQDKLSRQVAGVFQAAGHKVSWNKDGTMNVDGRVYHIPDAVAAAPVAAPPTGAPASAPAPNPVGAPATGSAAPKVGDTKQFPNGRIGRWDGLGWVQIQ